MDFLPNEEQEELKRVVGDFIRKEAMPQMSSEEGTGVPKEFLQKAARIGLCGLTADPVYGGAGLTYLDYALSIEEAARVWWPAGILFAYINSLHVFPLNEAGNDQQKQAYLVPSIRAERLGSYALTEPEAGSDAANIKTKAELKGKKWVLNGRKRFITNANVADYCIVFARTDPSKKPSAGISAFIVDTDQPGFQVEQVYSKMGLDSSPTCEVVLDNAEVPAENLLGVYNEGFKLAMKTLDVGRIGVAASAVGASQWALEKTINYVKQRQQFGQPLALFQGIQFDLANVACDIEKNRLLTYKAAWLKGAGLPCTKIASMAKLEATEKAVQIGLTCQRLLGGYGYMKESLIERMIRDVIAYTLFEGTSNIQRLIIAKEILLKGNIS